MQRFRQSIKTLRAVVFKLQFAKTLPGVLPKDTDFWDPLVERFGLRRSGIGVRSFPVWLGTAGARITIGDREDPAFTGNMTPL